MSTKTHTTAIVVTPPESYWEPIQAIRREHDRHVGRWMPHITVIYPFRARNQFDAVSGQLRSACAGVEPFTIRLDRLQFFHHGGQNYTMWLAPEPREPLAVLQAALVSVVPDCDEGGRHLGGFNPHLSVGQVRGRERLERLIGELQAAWRPISFEVASVALIWRNEPPDDVFRVDRTIRLGR